MAARPLEPSRARLPPDGRIPLSTLTIPLGLAGLAQVWSVATTAFAAPYRLAEALWLVAALAWAWTVVAHTWRGARTDQRLRDQLAHLAHGPLASLWPITAMLLGLGLRHVWPIAGTITILVATGVSAVFAAWITTRWMGGDVPLEAVHGGFYLPISAAGLIGALSVGQAGIPRLATACFAIGCFFWLLTTVLLFLRLALGPALPAALVPTLAIMVAPPAVAASAWLTISGGRPDALFAGLTGITAFLALVQVPLLRRYRALDFSHAFWSFTFPAAALAGLSITWLKLEEPVGWRTATVGVVACVTALVLAIAFKSVRLVRTDCRDRRLGSAADPAEVPGRL